MSFVYADRIKETTTTTGTGDITLAGAMTSMRAFSSVLADGDMFYYTIQAVDGSGIPTGDWEVGTGTYHSGGTFTRTQVRSSSTGSILTLASGTKQVWLDQPANGGMRSTMLHGSSYINHLFRGSLCVGASYGTSVSTAGAARFVAVRVPTDCMLASTVFVTTAITSAKGVFALYGQTTTNGQPGPLLYTFSELDCGTTGQKTSTAQFVPAGDYWCYYNFSAAVTVRCLVGSSSTGPGFMPLGDAGSLASNVLAGGTYEFRFDATQTYSASPPSDATVLTLGYTTGSNTSGYVPMFVVT